MSKEKRIFTSDTGKLPSLHTQQSAATLEKNSDQIGQNIPQKQIFSQELITRLTDRIKTL